MSGRKKTIKKGVKKAVSKPAGVSLDVKIAGNDTRHETPVVKPEMARLEQPGERKKKKKDTKRRQADAKRRVNQAETPEKPKEQRAAGRFRPDRFSGTEQDKRLIMWSGITFFMLLIITFWALNIKNILRKTEIEDKGDVQSVEWDELKSEVGEAIDEFRNGLTELKPPVVITSGTGTASSVQSGFLPGDGSGDIQNAVSTNTIMELKEKLEKNMKSE